MPTLQQMGGYNPGGNSLARVVTRSDAASNRGTFSQWFRGESRGYSVRSRQYRYTEWREGSDLQLELYDHELAPDETTSVAAQPEYANVLDALQQALAAGGRTALPQELW